MSVADALEQLQPPDSGVCNTCLIVGQIGFEQFVGANVVGFHEMLDMILDIRRLPILVLLSLFDPLSGGITWNVSGRELTVKRDVL